MIVVKGQVVCIKFIEIESSGFQGLICSINGLLKRREVRGEKNNDVDETLTFMGLIWITNVMAKVCSFAKNT